ncbi:MAG TPA: hypothetical protein VNR89_04155 [Roseomonas sp.]|nr:hypothetical protein [Roseomonas sp.]
MVREPYDLIGRDNRHSNYGTVTVAFCRNRRGWLWMAPGILAEWSDATYCTGDAAFRAAFRVLSDIEARLAA